MNIRYMTLDGKFDRERFISEWENSENRWATFLQTEFGIYVMPYGRFNGHVPASKQGLKFEGSYRRHKFIQRDFELYDKILGGGYLQLSGRSCAYVKPSTDFGAARDTAAIEAAVQEQVLN